MDTSEAGYSFIRQLDAGAAAQDAFRLGFSNRGGIKGAHQSHAAAQRSAGADVGHPQAHRTFAHSGSDAVHNDQTQQVSGGPGWAVKGPSQKQKKKKNKRKWGCVNDSSEPQGSGHAPAPCSQQPATGGAHSQAAVGTKKKKRKRKGQQNPQHQPGNKAGGDHTKEHPEFGKKSRINGSSAQQQSQARATWKDQCPPQKPVGQAGPSSAAGPAVKNPFLSKMKSRKLAAASASPAKQQGPELHGLSSDEASEEKLQDGNEGSQHLKKDTFCSIQSEQQVRVGTPQHGAAERRVGDPEEQPQPTPPSASVHDEPEKTDGRSTESCATIEHRHQPMAARAAASIPLAERIRSAHTGQAHDIGATTAEISAPSTSCHPPSGSRRASEAAWVKSATAKSIAQPAPTTHAPDKVHKPPTSSVSVKMGGKSATKSLATKKAAQPRSQVAGTQQVEQPPVTSASAKISKQPASKAPATKKVAQPVSATQIASSTQSRPKQGTKRVHPVADNGPTASAKQHEQVENAPSALSAMHKRPHIGSTAPAGSGTACQPAPLWLTPPGGAAVTTATKPAATQEMPCQSQPQPSPVSGAVQRPTSASVHEDKPGHADACAEPLAPEPPVSAPSDLLQQSTTSLLQQWMVQEDSGAASGLLQTWCALASAEAASASAEHPDNSSAARDEQGATGAVDLPRADGSKHTKQGAQGTIHASSPAPERGGAQKRRFQPTGRAAKKPSIHLSFESCGHSYPAEEKANVQLRSASPEAERPAAGTKATQGAVGEVPGVPLTAGSDSAAGATDGVVPCDPASQAAPAAQSDAPACEGDGSDAAFQQPDAATINIMLQNIAKHGAIGSSTAQIPTRLLQSMAQCMDKLLQQQQQSKQDDGAAAEPTPNVAPEHDEGDDAGCETAGQSSAKDDLHSGAEATQPLAEQPGQGERSSPDTAANLPDVPFPVTSTPVVHLPAAEPRHAHEGSPSPSSSGDTDSDDSDDVSGAVHGEGMEQATDGDVGVTQAQRDSVQSPQQGSVAGDAVQGRCAVPMERQRNVEVEEMEWACRQAELEKQRRAVQAERRARAQQNAVVRARAQRQKELSEMEQRCAMRSALQGELDRIVLPGMSLQQALSALGFHPGPGAEGEKAALKQARVFHHPDSSRRRGGDLRQQIMSEEIFKILGSLA